MSQSGFDVRFSVERGPDRRYSPVVNQTTLARPGTSPLLPSRREMVRAVLASDASYDAVFFAAVRTTAVFCRPSCRARKPRPENLEFFGAARDAMREGYRPCLRCRPLEGGAVPEWARSLLAAVEREPARRFRDADLRNLGIEPARARRWFLKRYGLTFQAFSRGRRLSGTLAALRRGRSIDAAVIDGGYASHSGFREAFSKSFETPPGKARALEAVTLAWMETPLGPMVAGATAEGICLLEFTDRRALERELAGLRRLLGLPVVAGETPLIRRLRAELADYFRGERRDFTVPPVLTGAPFEREVWSELLKIPWGETRSYEELAAAIGRPSACRAVGSANGRNRIAILVPCHRVVRKDGTLGGYGGGLWRKQRLLEIESP
jgi:AraC family transcriptional regulator of adaptative response/methylated-DNA-[protein]-cysteine methyltransferase